MIRSVRSLLHSFLCARALRRPVEATRRTQACGKPRQAQATTQALVVLPHSRLLRVRQPLMRRQKRKEPRLFSSSMCILQVAVQWSKLAMWSGKGIYCAARGMLVFVPRRTCTFRCTRNPGETHRQHLFVSCARIKPRRMCRLLDIGTVQMVQW